MIAAKNKNAETSVRLTMVPIEILPRGYHREIMRERERKMIIDLDADCSDQLDFE